MAVRYQYPNENSITVADGVSYQLDLVSYYSPGTRVHPIFAVQYIIPPVLGGTGLNAQANIAYTICTTSPLEVQQPLPPNLSFYTQEILDINTNDVAGEIWGLQIEGEQYFLRSISSYFTLGYATFVNNGVPPDNYPPTIQDYLFEHNEPLVFPDNWNDRTALENHYQYRGRFPSGYIEKWANNPDNLIYAQTPFFLHWWSSESLTTTPVWELTIYRNNGNALFFRSSLDEPLVEIVQNECPPNTCAVDCGEHICCYGGDGIAIDYFIK